VHIVAVEQPLPFLLRQTGQVTRAPLTLRTEYQIGVTSSSLAIYKYNRNVLSVSLSYQY
jgi:hypothetical protein